MDPLSVTHKPIPYKDSKLIYLSTVDAVLRLVHSFSGSFDFYINQYHGTFVLGAETKDITWLQGWNLRERTFSILGSNNTLMPQEYLNDKPVTKTTVFIR